MNPCAPFIKRPIMTTLITIAIAFFGAVSYRALPVSNMPDVEFPTIQVKITYPGADPTTIANNVVTPLEQQFATIPGIRVISSTSQTGSGVILLQFDLSRSIDLAAPDVLASINAASAQLPKDLPYAPAYSKANPTSTPLLIFSLTSDTLTRATLYDYAYSVLANQLNLVEGVSQIQTWGTPYAVRIQVDPQMLYARSIGLNEFAQAIQDANVYLPTGNLYNSKKEYTIDCDGQIMHAEEYKDLIIKNNDGLITRVRDVGKAFDSLWNDKIYVHYSNKQIDQSTVSLGVQKEAGANALSIIKGIDERLAQLQKQLPASIKIWRVYDQSDYIKESVEDVERTLLIALCLVVAVIFLYLGRVINTIIPTLAIPLSVLGAFVVMKVANFSIDILSLLAITLAIGFLVDDAIVMLENVTRHAETGKSRLQAAIDGSKEISFTILSMTICLAAIFIPLVFMEGIIGRVLREFSLTIVAIILLSGVVSLTATPMLSSRFIATTSPSQITRLQRISNWINESTLKIYLPSLKWAIHHRKTILLAAFLCLGATLYLMIFLPKDFLPDDDIGFIQCYVQAQDGTSPFAIGEKIKEITEILQKNPYVNQMICLGAVSQHNQGLLYINLVDIRRRPSTRQVMRDFYHTLSSVLGVQIFLKPLPIINLQVGASSSKGDYQYTLQSLSSDDLYPAASKLLNRLSTLTQITHVTSDLDIAQPQLKVKILRDKASLYGISAHDIERALSLAFADINLSPINEPNNQYYVIMEVLPKFYQSPDMLSQIWLHSAQNGLVPLSEVVQMTEDTGPLTVNHINGLPSATITFNLAPNVPLETALNAVHQTASEILPTTVFGKIQGAADIFKQSFANLNFLLLITIFVIYIILGILYENFFHPITVMSTLPPAAFGGLLTLLLCGYSFSLYAFVGIIMLLGIVLKNGIILVDFANEATSKEGKTSEEAILHACRVRLRPILMTTFAALMGALPIAIGLGGLTAQGRRPLGAVIVGGLLISQVLTLYLTPVTYLYIEKLRQRLIKKS